MSAYETNNQGGPTNDRNNTSGSGRVGPEVRSDSGREAVSRGRDGRRRGGSLHLGVRGVDQVNHWQVLDEIVEAIRELNQTLKNKL